MLSPRLRSTIPSSKNHSDLLAVTKEANAFTTVQQPAERMLLEGQAPVVAA